MPTTTPEVPAALRVLGVIVENFKRVELVELAPDGRTVVVGGRNEQGKTSLLDAIEATLRTPKRGERIELPLKKGARRGRVRLDLGELIAELEVTAKGAELAVEQPPGTPVKKPRGVLDALGIDLSFDPLAFSHGTEAEQGETLRRLSGCDARPIDARRAEAYAKRTAVNAEHRKAEMVIDGIKVPPAPPPAPEAISVAALMEDRGRLVGRQEENARVTAAHVRIRAALEVARAEEQEAAKMLPPHRDAITAAAQALAAVATVVGEISEVSTPAVPAEWRHDWSRLGAEAERVHGVIKSWAAGAGEQLDAMQELKDEKGAVVVRLDRELADAAERVGRIVDRAADIAAIDAQLRDADAHNAKVAAAVKLLDEHARVTEARRKQAAEVSRLASESRKLTDVIEGCDGEKAALLAGAKLPIAGLGFEGEAVIFHGLPLRQASQSGKVRVGCAIAAALNPRLKIVLVRDGALLDDESLREMIATLEALGVQPWIEVVGERAGVNVVIEDGRVKGAASAAAEGA